MGYSLGKKRRSRFPLQTSPAADAQKRMEIHICAASITRSGLRLCEGCQDCTECALSDSAKGCPQCFILLA